MPRMWKLLLSFALPIALGTQFSSKYHEKSALFADHSRLSLHQSANSTVGFTTGMGESSTEHNIKCDTKHTNFCLRTQLGHKNAHKPYIDGYLMKKRRWKSGYQPRYFRVYTGKEWSAGSLKWWNGKDIDEFTRSVKIDILKRMLKEDQDLKSYFESKADEQQPKSDHTKGVSDHTKGVSTRSKPGGGMTLNGVNIKDAMVISNKDLRDKVQKKEVVGLKYHYGGMLEDELVKDSKQSAPFKKKFPKQAGFVNLITNGDLHFKSAAYYDFLWEIANDHTRNTTGLGVPDELRYGGHKWTEGKTPTLKMTVAGGGAFGSNRDYQVLPMEHNSKVCDQKEIGTPAQLCPSLADLQQALTLMEKGYPEWMKTCKAIESKHPKGMQSLSLAAMCNGIQDANCHRIAEVVRTYSPYKGTGCEDLTYDLTLNKPFEPHKVGIEVEMPNFIVTTWTDAEVNRSPQTGQTRVRESMGIDRKLAKTYSVTMPGAPSLIFKLELQVDHFGGSYEGAYAHVEAIFGPTAKTDDMRKINTLMRNALEKANTVCPEVNGKHVPKTDIDTMGQRMDIFQKKFGRIAKTFRFSCFVQEFNKMLHRDVHDRTIVDAYTLHLPPFEDEVGLDYVEPDHAFVIKVPADVDTKIDHGAWAQINFGVPLSHFGNGAYMDYLSNGRRSPAKRLNLHMLELWGAVLADELLKHLEHCYDPNTYAQFEKLFKDARFKGLLTIAFQIMLAKIIALLIGEGETSARAKNILFLLPKTGAADLVRLLPADLQKLIHKWFSTKPKASEPHSVVDLFQNLLTSGSDPFADLFLTAYKKLAAYQKYSKEDYHNLHHKSPIGSVLVGEHERNRIEVTGESRSVKLESIPKGLDIFAKKQIEKMLTAVFKSANNAATILQRPGRHGSVSSTSQEHPAWVYDAAEDPGNEPRFIGESETEYGHKINPDRYTLTAYNFGGSLVNSYPCYSKGTSTSDEHKKGNPFDDVMVVIEHRQPSINPDLHKAFMDDKIDLSSLDGAKTWDKFRKDES